MPDSRDYEVDLQECFKVIAKRKIVILAVFFASVIAAITLSFTQPKKYEVSMIIEPPIMGVKNTGIENLDSVENIRAKIEEGAFNTKIINKLNLTDKVLKFKISSPPSTRLIKISIEMNMAETSLGVKILKQLIDELKLNYSQFIKDKEGELDNQIAIISNQIHSKENDIKLKSEQIKIIDDRSQKLLEDIKESKANSDKLRSKGEALLANKENKDSLLSLFYTATMQQDIIYFSQLQNDLSALRTDRESALTAIENIKNSIQEYKINIKSLIMVKDGMHNIVLIQEPLVSLSPNYSNKRFNIVFSGVLGLIFGLFLAFSMEYWQKLKKQSLVSTVK